MMPFPPTDSSNRSKIMISTVLFIPISDDNRDQPSKFCLSNWPTVRLTIMTTTVTMTTRGPLDDDDNDGNYGDADADGDGVDGDGDGDHDDDDDYHDEDDDDDDVQEEAVNKCCCCWFAVFLLWSMTTLTCDLGSKLHAHLQPLM